MEARAALVAANELLRYRPVDDVYEEWLDRVAELVRAAGGSPALSHHATPAPLVIAALLGDSQAPPTSHHVKPFVRWVSAASTR